MISKFSSIETTNNVLIQDAAACCQLYGYTDDACAIFVEKATHGQYITLTPDEARAFWVNNQQPITHLAHQEYLFSRKILGMDK